MHPGLVAGAWVGFNDARVTIRSDYWGQGAHNALYLVGDFFRQAFNTGALDSRLAFPRRPSGSFFGPIIDRVYDWVDRRRGIIRTLPDNEAGDRHGSDKSEEKEFNLEDIDRMIDRIKLEISS